VVCIEDGHEDQREAWRQLNKALKDMAAAVQDVEVASNYQLATALEHRNRETGK